MRSDARAEAAIAILDRILAGEAAEAVLTTWGRGARYAGSGDRAAVRDLVFDALRQKRSAAARGGDGTGRGMLLGLLRAAGQDPAQVFTGAPHAPAVLTSAEREGGREPAPGAEALDLPDWIWDRFRSDLAEKAADAAEALRHRAPVFLRVNSARATREGSAAALAEEGIATRPHRVVSTALEVTDGARRIRSSRTFAAGLVELQDASSQAAVLDLPIRSGARILDFCAGGGGKALAIAALTGGRVVAHDIDPARMTDLPARALRAGARIEICAPEVPGPTGPFDLVLADAPCSGSGTWRRAPEAKWRLTEDGLGRYLSMQDEVLRAAAGRVAPGGILAYSTCSVMSCENSDRIAGFLAAHSGWTRQSERQWLPGPEGDGFYLAVLVRQP